MNRRSLARFAAAVACVAESGETETFLGELLTPAELHDLVLRWELMELLEQGVSQRQIAARLGVSLCKITRGAKILKRPGSVAARLLAKTNPSSCKGCHAGPDVTIKPADQARR